MSRLDDAELTKLAIVPDKPASSIKTRKRTKTATQWGDLIPIESDYEPLINQNGLTKLYESLDTV